MCVMRVARLHARNIHTLFQVSERSEGMETDLSLDQHLLDLDTNVSMR